MENIFEIFSSETFYLLCFFTIFLGAIIQSSVGFGFGISAAILILFDPRLVPGTILVMGTFLATTNAIISFKNIYTKDLIVSLSGRILGSLISLPLLLLTFGKESFLIVFAIILIIAVYFSAKKFNIVANAKNVFLASTISGFMGTITGIGGPPMGIVYQNSKSVNVSATLNAFFSIGAFISVIMLMYTGIIHKIDFYKALMLLPAVILGISVSKLSFIKNYIDNRFKNVVLAICVITAALIMLKFIIGKI
ncbi:MAG: sulfite exporter TauE/SafE family protein [Candidatus Pelagibacter sp.]|nr:sulfite exporter TauE/SafE family protein [Candidatus Pelagibacter sp.]